MIRLYHIDDNMSIDRIADIDDNILCSMYIDDNIYLCYNGHSGEEYHAVRRRFSLKGGC